MIDILSLVIGVLSLVFVYFGLIFPEGKSSIILMIIPAQIAYFTMFQYDQIPLTFSGFNNLQYSNGFNQLTSQT